MYLVRDKLTDKFDVNEEKNKQNVYKVKNNIKPLCQCTNQGIKTNTIIEFAEYTVQVDFKEIFIKMIVFKLFMKFLKMKKIS